MGRWNEGSDVYQKSNWGGTGSSGLEKMLHLWSSSRLGIPHTASLSLMRFLRWHVSFCQKGKFQRALLRFLFLCFLPQSGTVECRRMSCPPLNCSPDSLPVHIAGQCCKVCRRKYWLRVRVVLCALRFFSPNVQAPADEHWWHELPEVDTKCMTRRTSYVNQLWCADTLYRLSFFKISYQL